LMAGSTSLVITRGAAGCTVLRAGQPATQLAALNVVALDTTGAGDCFAAALCHWLSRGFDVVAAARFATASASLSTSAIGAQGALPDEAAVEEAAKNLGARPPRGRRA
jgi:ribokinase